MIWFGFFLSAHPMIRWDIRADIGGGYDVRWDVYYQTKNGTVDITANSSIIWDRLTFIVIFNPDKVQVDMGDLQYDSISSNIYKVDIDGPIKFDKYDKITTIWYKGDRDKINISDVTIYNKSTERVLSITNIP